MIKIKRRKFLVQTAAGFGGVLIGTNLGQSSPSDSNTFNPYERVLLGKTGLMVSRIGLGTGTRGSRRESNHTRLGKEKFSYLLRHAYDRGVRLFDLADLYGSHPYLIPALDGLPRDAYTIVTKIWFRRGGIPEPDRPPADQVVKRFLKEINTEYIDLVLLHCVISERWNEEQSSHMELLQKLKQQGIIRAHGVSCHSLAALKTAAREPWVDSVHTRINAYGDKMDDAPENVVPVLEKIHRAGKGVIGMKLIGEGMYRNDDEKRNRSLDYVLNLGYVDSLVVGCESVAELDDLAARIAGTSKKV